MVNYELRSSIRKVLLDRGRLMSAGEIHDAMLSLNPPVNYTARQIAQSIRMLPDNCNDYFAKYDERRKINLYGILI